MSPAPRGRLYRRGRPLARVALHTNPTLPPPAPSASPRLTRYRTLQISETIHARAEHGLFHVQCRGACEENM
jgi:hypothetical protein